MIQQSLAHVYLFRHGKVQLNNHEMLSEFGISFRDALPAFFRELGVELAGAYYDASVKRCEETLERLACPKVGYAPGRDLRTLNAALSSVGAGHHAVCCRGDSVESGQLYHVQQFELHTPFGSPLYAQRAREALRNSYHKVYCLRFDGRQWAQLWKRGLPDGAEQAP